MKKFTAMLLALVLVLSMTAAVSALAEDKPTIAYVPKVIGQPWWDHVHDAVDAWAAETGYDVIYQGPAETDPAAQVQIMTDLVNQGIDILCFSPNDPDACEEICKQAREQGIIVIATEASGMTNVDFDVEAFDEAGLGAFLMDELAKQMGGEGEYITMVGSFTMESQNNWADAAVAQQEAAYPDMVLVEDKRVEDNSDAAEAYNLCMQLKEKYPNLKGILGTGSFDAPGCARAIEEMGLAGQMFAISVALPSEVRDYMHDGVLQSVALWDPGVTAAVQLNAGLKLFAGEEITTGTDLQAEGFNSVDVQGTVIVGQGFISINPDNVDEITFA